MPRSDAVLACRLFSQREAVNAEGNDYLQMPKKVLITSFSTWKPHHRVNSSDELLRHIEVSAHHSLHFLRRLPVDFQEAPRQVMAEFDALKPDILICCGMAEERQKLHIESQATVSEETLTTKIDLHCLTSGLPMTEVSHDAGRFVCNTLYFHMLRHLGRQAQKHHCIFAHVPVLTPKNTQPVKSDFLSIIDRMATL
jgi:pyroglutamyl-peptidase